MKDGQEIRSILAQNIKSFRAQNGWSQADLAERANISIPFLSDIERGNKWPFPETLEKIAKSFEVDVFELFHKESPSIKENRDYTERVVKELLSAQNKATDEVWKKYLE
jgi:transcriptional regulator with XRE-family HTH domain